MPPRPQPRFYAFGPDRAYLITTGVVMSTYVIEAPLRYLLHLGSFDALIYLRDVVCALLAASILVSWLVGQVTATLYVGVCCVLAGHTLIGMMFTATPLQPLFGLKQYLPFLLGLAIAPLVTVHARAIVRYAFACFAVTTTGVLANAFVDYPWVGLTYETVVGPQELSRQWWTSTGLRLPGFTRASYLAAQLTLASAVPLLALRLGWFRRLTVYVLAALTIWLTTTKGAWTGLAALAVSDLLLAMPGFTPFVGVVLTVLFSACLALPLIGVQIGTVGGTVPRWAESFMERIGDMWPRAFALLDGPVSVVTGRGIGGIGYAQTIGESYRFNAADNLMVFLVVTFGVLGPLYLGFVIARLVGFVRRPPLDLPTRWAICWTAVLLGVGMTTGMLEDPIASLTLGVTLGVVCRTLQPSAAGEPQPSGPAWAFRTSA